MGGNLSAQDMSSEVVSQPLQSQSGSVSRSPILLEPICVAPESGYCVVFDDRAAVVKTYPALLRSRVDQQWCWIHSGTRKKGPTTPLALISHQAVTFGLRSGRSDTALGGT